jgi:hypothetical protein
LAKPNSKFRNASNQRLTKQLFFEECYGKEDKYAVYTLKDWDHEGYPSLYRLYMEMGDLKEYEFAETYLDGYDHWQMLCKAPWFKPHITRWREELLLREQGQALNRIREVARAKEHKSAYEANKFLLAGSWAVSGHSKGRPTKDQVKAEAERIATAEKQISEDAERILN